MKATYFVALFALFAVANAYGSDVYTKDSKTQHQSASGTQSEVSDNSGNLVGANQALKGAVNVASSKEQNAAIKQEQDM